MTVAEALRRGSAMMLDNYGIKIGSDGAIYVDGEFLTHPGTIAAPISSGGDYIATWNGREWGTVGDGTEWLGYHHPCRFCGNAQIPGEAVACLSCGAPTAAWWPRLDGMIADWKRGLAG